MKIQDMRSGISHLSKKMNGEGREDNAGAPTIAERDVEPRREVSSELDESCWSVVSFDKREAGGLTYQQAAELIAVLDKYGVNGLCLITDEAAKRYNG
jgi:hypothetical protein